MRITQMRCEYQESPIGIDTEPPRVSWTYKGDTAWHQKDFQLFFSYSPHKLKPLKDGVWGLPLVLSAQSAAVYNKQIPLRPHTTYYWRVKATDGKRSVLSPIASFETAKLNETGWMGW